MDIQKEIEILEYQPIVFFKGAELANLYKEVVKYNNLKVGSLAASVFCNLGRTHGIREERARRKKQNHFNSRPNGSQ